MSLLSTLLPSLHPELSRDQAHALGLLAGDGNVFITGGAGTGKSYLLKKFLHRVDVANFPLLASTGAAAVLLGGRTFHSFFGLGLMEGGVAATVARSSGNRRVVRRLKKLKGFVVDEISMLPGVVLEAAEQIAQMARGDSRPWGGLRVVAVGDFSQLPPVTKNGDKRDWAFLSRVWERTGFQGVALKQMMRTQSSDFASILNDVREGEVTQRVQRLLEDRSLSETNADFEGSILYARKTDVERVNLYRLGLLEGKPHWFHTDYQGEERFLQALKANAPIPQVLELKKDALVMIRQNDPQGRFVNGSLGHIRHISDHELEVELLKGGKVDLEKTRFSMLDAEGNEVASAHNFPVNLAYAMTIHKAQGATLDKAVVTLKNLWEPGQAYVAMSRVRAIDDLWVDGWDRSSIRADMDVKRFHERISKELENPPQMEL